MDELLWLSHVDLISAIREAQLDCDNNAVSFIGVIEIDEFAGLENDGLEKQKKINSESNTTPKSFMKSTLSNSVDKR